MGEGGESEAGDGFNGLGNASNMGIGSAAAAAYYIKVVTFEQWP